MSPLTIFLYIFSNHMYFSDRKKEKNFLVIQVHQTFSTLENLSGRSGFSKFILQTFFPEDSSIEPCWILVWSTCLVSLWSSALPHSTIYKPAITAIAPNKLKWGKYIRWQTLEALISHLYLFLVITNRFLHKDNKFLWRQYSKVLFTLPCKPFHVER